MDDLSAAKKAVRERLLRARAELPESESREKSAAIRALVEGIGEYANACGMLFYMPIGGEVDVTPLIVKALKEGKLCALPKCAPGRSLRLFAVPAVEGEVSPGAMGIPEPEGDASRECLPCSLPVLILPGVAYDRSGRRLGRGAGYYDRLLSDTGINALKIAPAYAFQVIPELPGEPHDAPVDIIVTEDEIIDCRKKLTTNTLS